MALGLPSLEWFAARSESRPAQAPARSPASRLAVRSTSIRKAGPGRARSFRPMSGHARAQGNLYAVVFWLARSEPDVRGLASAENAQEHQGHAIKGLVPSVARCTRAAGIEQLQRHTRHNEDLIASDERHSLRHFPEVIAVTLPVPNVEIESSIKRAAAAGLY